MRALSSLQVSILHRPECHHTDIAQPLHSGILVRTLRWDGMVLLLKVSGKIQEGVTGATGLPHDSASV